jgi:hypothetical protein
MTQSKLFESIFLIFKTKYKGHSFLELIIQLLYIIILLVVRVVT